MTSCMRNVIILIQRLFLSAIPQVDADDRTERIHLTGEVPSPSDPPSGCPFHTRCPKACDVCSKEIPQLKEIEKGHFCGMSFIPVNEFNQHIKYCFIAAFKSCINIYYFKRRI